MFSTAAHIVFELTQEGSLTEPASREPALKAAFAHAGLADMIDEKVAGKTFYQMDFPSLVSDEASARKLLKPFFNS